MNLPLPLLLEPVRPMWRYCLVAVPVALVPSGLFFLGAVAMFRLAGIDPDRYLPPMLAPTAREFFGAVVFSPIVETLLLAGLLTVLSKVVTRPILVASVSAVAWGGLHALSGLLWFFGTAWSLFVFSCAFLAWREVSFKRAYVAAAVPHALINLAAFVGAAAV